MFAFATLALQRTYLVLVLALVRLVILCVWVVPPVVLMLVVGLDDVPQ